MNLYITLARSNPAIIRKLYIEDKAVIGDMVKAIQISFAIDEPIWKLCIDGNNCKDEDILSDVASDKSSAFLDIYKDSKQTESIRFFIDFCTTDGGNDTKLPTVLDHCGINIPSNLFSMRGINYVQDSFNRGHRNVQFGNIICTESLLFDEKRTDNQMRKVFAPETATKDVNTRNAIPHVQILWNFSVKALRQLGNAIDANMYGVSKKAEYIDSLMCEFDSEFIRDMLDELSVAEYQSIKEFALSEDDDCGKKIDEQSSGISTLIAYGYLYKVGLNKYLMATEMLSSISELIMSGNEEDFIKEKYLRCAAKICANYYVIYSKDLFIKVVNAIKEIDIDEKMAEDYFRLKIEDIESVSSCRLDDETKHNYEIISNETAAILWQAMSHKASDYYIPDKNTILKYQNESPTFSKEGMKKLLEYYERYAFYNYYNSWNQNPNMEKIEGLISRVRSSYTKKLLGNYIESIYYKVHYLSDKARKQVLAEMHGLLDKEAEKIPIIIYGGYTAKNCPAETKKAVDGRFEKLIPLLEKSISNRGNNMYSSWRW